MSRFFKLLQFLIISSFISCTSPETETPIAFGFSAEDRYGDAWQINAFWGGEYPSGLAVLEPEVVIQARAALNPELPLSINCTVNENDFYHPWNTELIAKRSLKFFSATKIQNYKALKPITTEISVETPNEGFDHKIVNYEVGDTIKYLGYTGEGYGLIEVDGQPAHVDLESVLGSTDRNPEVDLPRDDLWIEMSCGAETGFVLVNELENRTHVEVSMEGILDYGSASNLSDDENSTQVPDNGALEFVCYRNDDNPDMLIWISYHDGRAQQVMYKKGSAPMDLSFVDSTMNNEGANPTLYSNYEEIHEGDINGFYKLIHSGVWDYAEYTRKLDGRVFNFTIDHDMTPYSSTPCFPSTPKPISWEQAIDSLNSGDVVSVSQRHNLTVRLDMKNGSYFKTIEPNIDAIVQEIRKCGSKCADILIATE